MKTLIRRAAIVLMIMALMSTTAFAGSIQEDRNANEPQKIHAQLEQHDGDVSKVEEKILAIGEEANASIYKEIDKAIVKVDQAENNQEIDKIIQDLIKKTNKITAVSIAKIEKLGGEAVCEWVEVEIGGQTILIDPIRIIRLR